MNVPQLLFRHCSLSVQFWPRATHDAGLPHAPWVDPLGTRQQPSVQSVPQLQLHEHTVPLPSFQSTHCTPPPPLHPLGSHAASLGHDPPGGIRLEVPEVPIGMPAEVPDGMPAEAPDGMPAEAPDAILTETPDAVEPLLWSTVGSGPTHPVSMAIDATEQKLANRPPMIEPLSLSFAMTNHRHVPLWCRQSTAPSSGVSRARAPRARSPNGRCTLRGGCTETNSHLFNRAVILARPGVRLAKRPAGSGVRRRRPLRRASRGLFLGRRDGDGLARHSLTSTWHIESLWKRPGRRWSTRPEHRNRRSGREAAKIRHVRSAATPRPGPPYISG
jgi:hypothetical protein